MQAVEPYARTIEQLRERQREKDAEILVLRYALVEMDRKIQELEKKNMAAATAAKGRTAAGTGARMSGMSTLRTTGLKTSAPATQVTPRSTSRNGGGVTNHLAESARNRSRTPGASSRV